MKIEGGVNPLTGPQGKKAANRSSEKKAGARAKDGDAYSVKLSATTEKLLSAAPPEEEIRWEMVTTIRNQLASGTYNISGKDVASKLLKALQG